MDSELPESIVHANQGILDICLGAEDTITTTRGKGCTSSAEAHVIVFDEHRPVRREHPFDTATSCPTSAVIRELANLRTHTIEKGYVRIGPGPATLPIEQDVRYHEISAASRQGIKPVRATVDCACERCGRKCPGLAKACPVEHIANAKHPRARLVIAADLTTTHNAAIAFRNAAASGNVANIEVRPASADVGAEITPGPKHTGVALAVHKPGPEAALSLPDPGQLLMQLGLQSSQWPFIQSAT